MSKKKLSKKAYLKRKAIKQQVHEKEQKERIVDFNKFKMMKQLERDRKVAELHSLFNFAPHDSKYTKKVVKQ